MMSEEQGKMHPRAALDRDLTHLKEELIRLVDTTNLSGAARDNKSPAGNLETGDGLYKERPY